MDALNYKMVQWLPGHADQKYFMPIDIHLAEVGFIERTYIQGSFSNIRCFYLFGKELLLVSSYKDIR